MDDLGDDSLEVAVAFLGVDLMRPDDDEELLLVLGAELRELHA